MNHAQNVRDAIDKIDETPFGQVGKFLDRMADDAQRAVNDYDALVKAAKAALNYIGNTEGELGIKLSCGDALREALGEQT